MTIPFVLSITDKQILRSLLDESIDSQVTVTLVDESGTSILFTLEEGDDRSDKAAQASLL